METKCCTHCDTEQPADLKHFGKRKTKTAQGWRWDSWCKKCYRDEHRIYNALNADQKRTADQAYRERTREFRRAYAVKYGREYNRREAVKMSRRKNHQALKLRCFEAYRVGREVACECCNESILNFLTLDHVNNDGKTHRAELGSGRNNGPGFYKWLEKNDFPQDLGLRILCQNCNWSRHWTADKKCPHELARQQLITAEPVRLNLAA